MITRAAWNALSGRRSIPANQPPDDRFKRESPSKQGIQSVATLSAALRRRLRQLVSSVDELDSRLPTLSTGLA
jgi:hypothetical protein